MISIVVDHYTCTLVRSSQPDSPVATISLFNSAGDQIGGFSFYPDKASIPDDYQDTNSGVYILNRHSDYFAPTIDLLRNESPLQMDFDDTAAPGFFSQLRTS